MSCVLDLIGKTLTKEKFFISKILWKEKYFWTVIFRKKVIGRNILFYCFGDIVCAQIFCCYIDPAGKIRTVMSKTFRDRFHIDFISCQDGCIAVPKLPPGKPWKITLFGQAIIGFGIKFTVVTLTVFPAAQVSQVQERWIFCPVFLIALTLKEDLFQDKISQIYRAFASFCFQFKFL